MRRIASLVVCLGLLAAACSSDSKDSASPSTTRASTSTTSSATSSTVPAGVVRTTTECTGIGAAPATAQITWIKDGRLWSADEDGTNRRCLLETGFVDLAWGGAADRVLLQDTAVIGDRIVELDEPERSTISFSLPTGKVVLARDDEGALFKVSVEDAPLVKLDTFANIDSDQAREVAYHPSGTAIVAAMPRGARPGLLLASNLGEDPRWLVDNETADRIYSVGFTSSGSVVFAAHHEDHTHLHQLDLATNTLETLVDSPDDEAITSVSTSPWSDGNIAAARDRDGDVDSVGPLWVVRDGEAVDLAGTAVARSRPVGWLPDGSLLVLVHKSNDDREPPDLYLVKGTTATLIERGVDAAAVRGVLPPPPPPPPRIDEAAPA